MPRILIADDDPISLRFLQGVLTQSGCDAVAVADGTSTLAAAAIQPFDLLLLDRRMPDIGGAELLAALRQQGVSAPAIATSAEIDAATAAQLRSTGFSDIIEKPVSSARLLRVVGAHVHVSSPPATAGGPTSHVLLDDQAALAATAGDAETLRALRSLLAQELAALETELHDSDPLTQPERWGERLHRLRASCGFCGAANLADAAQKLDHALRKDAVSAQSTFVEFSRILRTTAAALHN
jgi:CheY-like chemotaxis protein